MATDQHTRGEWNREQWEGEGQGDGPQGPESSSELSGHWQKEQWEGEGQGDHPRHVPPADDAPRGGEGDSELSGHGENPGGGKQWGNVERAD